MKKPQAAPVTSVNSVANCNFEIINSANEHTRDAIIALANAAAANAKAIEIAAQALQGSNVTSYGVSFGK